MTSGLAVAALGLGGPGGAAARPGARPGARPDQRSAVPGLRKAARLRPGDRLGLVAPAGFIADRFGIDEIAASVRAMGLEPVFAPHVTARYGYLAGEDAARAGDLMAMFEDASIAGIMAVRGGWGCARILPLLDWQRIAARPKLFAGFSDVTALHLALAARTGLVTVHGPNASASWPQASWDWFRALAFDGAQPTYAVSTAPGTALGRPPGEVRVFHPGKARGRLYGGNLSVLCALLGTPYLPDLSGAILFVEDTNEAEYRIDRMLTQLALAGVLGKLAGLVFGQCTHCENPDPSWGNFTVYEVMDQHFSRLGIPAFQGALVGHVAEQISLPEGCMAEIDAQAGTIRLLESAVT